MKICLVNAPLVTRKNIYYVPLGLAYIAAAVREHGYDVSVADSQVQSREHILQSTARADIVGITCMSCNSPVALSLAQDIKKVNPSATIVMGGPHVTFTDVEILQRHLHVDVIVRGEGEYTTVKMLHALDKGDLSDVKGITYRRDGAIKRNPEQPFIKDMDSLPFPARDLLKAERYYEKGSVARIISGRGCPFKCIFCSASSMWGHKVRLRSPHNVVDEMEQVLNTYNLCRFNFVDDTFTILSSHTADICREILDRGLDVRWGCNVRVDTLSEELVQLMKRAGCTSFFVGVESGNQKTLDFINKKTTVQQIQKAVELAKKYSIETALSCIVGLPTETYTDVQKTIDFMISLKGDRYLFNFLIVYPGTELEKRQKELGLKPIAEDTWERIAKTPFEIPTVETKTLSVGELSKLFIEMKLKLERLRIDEEVEEKRSDTDQTFDY